MTRLSARNLGFRYADDAPWLVRGLDLDIEPGAMIASTGPNGGGKSTLLRLLCGVLPDESSQDAEGEILLNDAPLRDLDPPHISNHMNLLWQNADTMLFFTSVDDEIAFGLENRLLPVDEIEQRVVAALQALNLSHLRYADPNSLSYGYRKQVALAALLAMEPDILLLDEPFAGLDESARQQVRAVLQDYAYNHAMVYAAHDLSLFPTPTRVISLPHAGASHASV